MEQPKQEQPKEQFDSFNLGLEAVDPVDPRVATTKRLLKADRENAIALLLQLKYQFINSTTSIKVK
jgi:hypothetical protein